MSRNAQGALTALLAMAIYATHDVVAKILGQHYHAAQIVFFAALLSFPLISVVLIHSGRSGSLRPVHPGWLLLRTICVVTTGLAAFHAFAVLPLAQTYAILFATPLMITLMAIPLLGERVGLHRGGAVVVGLIGVLVVLRPGGVDLSMGHLSALAAAVMGALASVIARKIGHDERATVMLLFPMLGNVLVMGAILPFVYRPITLPHLGFEAIIATFGLIAAALSIRAYRMAEAVIVAPMQYSQIIWATLFGLLLFDEGVDGPTLLGAGIIIASGVYIVLREGRAGTSPTQPVLAARMRSETGITPRTSLIQRLWFPKSRDDGGPI
ncbi:DMT family transporter [Paracoccus sp. p4-l81]|uniref:DMT family transporter n=1 Tax=Paracoccus sp. p4-l81 TaxID=3342806 RepID=UPI0035BB0398